MGKVIVRKGKNGGVVSIAKSQGNGYILLEQMVPYQNPKTKFIEEKKRTALLFGLVEMLLALKWKEGQEIEGKIAVMESFTKTSGMCLKIAGDTGVSCKKDGKPIYHKTSFSFNPDEPDVRIVHDNNQEIGKAARIQREFDTSQA